MPPASKPRGTRGDGPRTKAEVVAAAQRLFSSRGYGQVGVRDIASAAGFDPALVVRVFGSKEKLFEAALIAAIDNEWAVIQDRMGLHTENFGAVLVDHFNATRPGSSSPFAMIIMATGDESARLLSARVLNERVIQPMVARLGQPDAEERAALITLLISGFVTYHDLLPLDALCAGGRPEARQWLADTIQRLFVLPGTA